MEITEKRLKIQHAAVLCFAVYALILVWQFMERTSLAVSVSVLIVIFAITALILMMRTDEKRDEAVHKGEMALVWLCILLFWAYGIYIVFFAGVL